MKAQKCRLYICTRTRMLDFGEFSSKRKARQYIRDLPYSVIYKIV